MEWSELAYKIVWLMFLPISQFLPLKTSNLGICSKNQTNYPVNKLLAPASNKWCNYINALNEKNTLKYEKWSRGLLYDFS